MLRRRSERRGFAWVVALALVATGLGTTSPTSAATRVTIDRVAGSDRVTTAVAISQRTLQSATTAVLARQDQFADALAAAPLAASLDAPLLLLPADAVPDVVRSELVRLGVTDIVLLGGTSAISQQIEDGLTKDHEVRRLQGPNRFATATALADELPAPSGAIVVSGRSFADALGAAPLAAHLGWPLLLTEADTLPAATRSWLAEHKPAQVLVVGGRVAISDGVAAEVDRLAGTVRRIAGEDRYATGIAVQQEAQRRGMGTSEVWLATGRAFPDALAAGAAVASAGASLLLVDGRDLREPLDVARHLRTLVDRDSGPLASVVLLGGAGAITANADWQLGGVLHGSELPRGGFTLFPRNRMVAFYGNHTASSMGVLGEQPPDQAYERLWRQAKPYEAGGRAVLPTFELIVSVATAGPGGDGDYSNPSSPEKIQPWLDAARRHGVYLLLDIQTGRTDFLTDAKRYEQFLSQPDVGLALDPEWRMDEGEVPGKSVGEVHADEVNAVADYLVDLVRKHDLPQKLLVVHQFQNRMVEQKHTIGSPPELAVLFHMDGHGSQQQKKDTYRHVSDSTGRWWNGFKLFYDEDRSMFTPEELLAEIRPIPDFISYQ